MRYRHRRTKAPKAPAPPKLPRPKSKDLTMIYKGLMTVSIENRLATLAYALHWYDTAMPYFVQKGLLTVEIKSKLEKAVLCRRKGMGCTDPSQNHEKETAFLMALRMYERAFEPLKPPRVDKFYGEFQQRKATLELAQQKMEDKYGEIIRLLQVAIGNRVKLNLADAPKLRQYDPSMSTASYNREAAKQMTEKMRSEGFMAVFIEQLDFLARYASLENDGKGGWTFDPQKQIDTMGEMLRDFVKFCRSEEAPKKLVRTPSVETPKIEFTAPVTSQPTSQAAPSSTAPATARPPRQRAKGPKIAGRYGQGSSPAIIYTELQDGKTHSVSELLRKIPAAIPMERLKDFIKDGKRFGGWNCAVNGDDIVMTVAGGNP